MKISSTNIASCINTSIDLNLTKNTKNGIKNPAFNGVIKFPNKKILMNPNSISTVKITNSTISKLGDFQDYYIQKFKNYSYSLPIPVAVNVIKRDNDKVEICKADKYAFSFGEHYKLTELGEITLIDGRIFKFKNEIETPEHCQIAEYKTIYDTRPIPPKQSDYDNFFNNQRFETIFAKALVDDKTYVMDNITLTNYV